jgi:putative endonuclease
VSRGNDVGAGRSSNDPRQSRGRAGEELACRFLEQNGYTIIETNHRSRYGEIDIIARKDGILAFIEVKTRLGKRYGEPFEAVGPRKQNQIRRMASMWVAANQGDPALRECDFRFDVISVYLSVLESQTGPPPGGKCGSGIVHMKDAFR